MAGAIKTVTFLVMLFAATVFAEDYDVGDDSGWIRPTNPNLYSDWASGKTFRVGDVLEFEFRTGAHDVAVVTKQAYDSCNKANPISLITAGPARFTLNTSGPHYFICTIGDHCTAGQKLSVNVVGATTMNPIPEAPNAAPPATNGASSLGAAATFSVGLMFSAFALFF